MKTQQFHSENILTNIGLHQLVWKTKISYVQKREKETTVKSRGVDQPTIQFLVH